MKSTERSEMKSRRARAVAILALVAVLATVMVPHLGPMARQVGERVVSVIGPGAPSDMAPALPATVVGDQYYDWSLAACIASGGVEKAESGGEGPTLIATHPSQ